MSQIHVDTMDIESLVGYSSIIVLATPKEPPETVKEIPITPQGEKDDPSLYPPFKKTIYHYGVIEILKNSSHLKISGDIDVTEAYSDKDFELHRDYYLKGLSRSVAREYYEPSAQAVQDKKSKSSLILFLSNRGPLISFTSVVSYESMDKKPQVLKLIKKENTENIVSSHNTYFKVDGAQLKLDELVLKSELIAVCSKAKPSFSSIKTSIAPSTAKGKADFPDYESHKYIFEIKEILHSSKQDAFKTHSTIEVRPAGDASHFRAFKALWVDQNGTLRIYEDTYVNSMGKDISDFIWDKSSKEAVIFAVEKDGMLEFTARNSFEDIKIKEKIKALIRGRTL